MAQDTRTAVFIVDDNAMTRTLLRMMIQGEQYQVVGEACKKHGKTLGMGGVYDEENASRYVAMGARFLLTGSDHSYIMSGASQRVGFFNGLPGAPV